MAKMETYLFFGGQCEEAFNYYAAVFDSKPDFSRFSDMPPGAPNEGIVLDRIMNVFLPMNDCVLRGCDYPSVSEKDRKMSGFSVVANADTKEEADAYFNALSEGGTINQKIQTMFWGAYFGMCIDKFGVQWMVSFGGPTGRPQ